MLCIKIIVGYVCGFFIYKFLRLVYFKNKESLISIYVVINLFE